MKAWYTVLMLLLVAPPVAAEDVLVIFDLSGSMGRAEEIAPARDTLAEEMAKLESPGVRWGLRVFGGCPLGEDTCLVVPLSTDGLENIRQRLPTLDGLGASPLGEALRAAREGELHDATWQRSVVVVSDGGVDRADACLEARRLREDGVRVTVIGLEFTGTEAGREVLRYVAEHPECAAGTYLRADRVDHLGMAINEVAAAALGLPVRLVALLLALLASFSTARLLEYYLGRATDLHRPWIPPLCRTAFLLPAVLWAGLLLAGDGATLFVVVAIVAIAVAALVYGGSMLLSGTGGGLWLRRALLRRARRRLLPLLLLAVVPWPAALAQPSCGSSDLRGRAGNDDLFVFIDSSLSMGPESFGDWATGDFERSQQVLRRLADCYLKRGDFVLVATFDSESRVEIAKSIVEPARDLALLREQIDGLGPTRPRYFERPPGGGVGPERAFGDASRRYLQGGSLRTDLVGALKRLNQILDAYRQPGHRQTVLLFTDGRHEPPEGTTYGHDESSLADLLPPPTADHSLGVVVLSSAAGTVEPWLQRAVEQRREDEAAVRLLHAEEGVDVVLAGLTELFNQRLDLVADDLLDLEPSPRPYVDVSFEVHNPSGYVREVIVKNVFFRLNSGGEYSAPQPLAADPSTLTLGPEESRRLTVRGPLQDLPDGSFSGELAFEFGGALTFHPREIKVRGEKIGWVEAYGPTVGISLSLLLLVSVPAFLLLRRHRRRAIWAFVTWRREGELRASESRALEVDQMVALGDVMNALYLEGSDRTIGYLWRSSVDELRISFGADRPSRQAGEWNRVTPEEETGVIGASGEYVCVYLHRNRQESRELATVLSSGSSML